MSIEKRTMFKVYSAPLEVFISLTERCNLSCSHCSVSSSPESRPEELTTEEWMDVIDEISSIKVFTVRLSGGEPFVHPGITKIIEKIAGSHIRFSVNTNAMLMDSDTAEFLKGYYDRIDDIMVSLDGSIPSVHDRLRGEGSFKKTLRGLELLLDKGLPVSIYTTVVRYNYMDIPRIVRLADRIGVTGIKLNELLPMGSALKDYRSIALCHEERLEVVSLIEGLRRDYGDFVQGTYADIMDIASRFKDIDKAGEPPYLNTCSAGTTQLVIRSDGWATPCDRLYDYKVGDVKKEGLSEVWHNSPSLNLFRKRFEMRIDDLPVCNSCEYRYGCTGGCPAVPHAIGDGIFSRDPLSCYRIFKGDELNPILEGGSLAS